MLIYGWCIDCVWIDFADGRATVQSTGALWWTDLNGFPSSVSLDHLPLLCFCVGDLWPAAPQPHHGWRVACILEQKKQSGKARTNPWHPLAIPEDRPPLTGPPALCLLQQLSTWISFSAGQIDHSYTYSPGHHWGESAGKKQGNRNVRRDREETWMRENNTVSEKQGSLSDRSDKVHHGVVMRSRQKIAYKASQTWCRINRAGEEWRWDEPSRAEDKTQVEIRILVDKEEWNNRRWHAWRRKDAGVGTSVFWTKFKQHPLVHDSTWGQNPRNTGGGKQSLT